MFYTKQKHDTVFYRTYKTSESKKSMTQVENELMKFDISNIEFQTLDNILPSVLIESPLKQKYLKAKDAGFITKDMRKAVTKRSQLRNHLLKRKIESSRNACNK